MNDAVEPLIEETIEVAATPEKIWSLVTDLPRMASWSPQVAKTIVRGGEVALGTRTININRDGLLVWPTRATVIRFEQHREFAFRVKDNRTIWSFTLEPTEAGTRVIQRREVPDGISDASLWLTKVFMGGTSKFQGSLRQGMQRTLELLKADAEA